MVTVVYYNYNVSRRKQLLKDTPEEEKAKERKNKHTWTETRKGKGGKEISKEREGAKIKGGEIRKERGKHQVVV